MENNNRAGHAQISARGDCVDLASAGSGRRSENPPALAVGSVKQERQSTLIRCPHGHILGVCWENGTVEIRHKGRTAVINSPNANVQITCEQCGKMVTVYLDCGKSDVEACI
jgi:hypothetical protein